MQKVRSRDRGEPSNTLHKDVMHLDAQHLESKVRYNSAIWVVQVFASQNTREISLAEHKRIHVYLVEHNKLNMVQPNISVIIDTKMKTPPHGTKQFKTNEGPPRGIIRAHSRITFRQLTQSFIKDQLIEDN